MKGRHTLVIDGNYFLFRTLHVLPTPRKGDLVLGDKKAVQVYVRKLATDLAYQIRLWEGLVGDVVWTLDSNSWRKDFFPAADYKGNREQSNEINWNNFKTAVSEFSSILNKHGVIISKVDGSEGDDLIYAWNTQCIAADRSVIILTGDRDLVQLVGYNQANDTHTILYSPVQSKLYVWEEFPEWLLKKDEVLESNDFFATLRQENSVENRVKLLISQLITKKKLDISPVDTLKFLFRKIVTGDIGDNVMPSYWYIKKDKNGKERMYKTSEAKSIIIVDELIKKNPTLSFMDLFNDDILTDLRNIIVKVMKANLMSPETILTNLKNNVQLMVLSYHTIPESIMDDMHKDVEANINKRNIKINEMSSMNSMLKGTEYEKAKIDMAAGALKDVKEEDDMSFITDRKKKGKLF